MTTLKLHAATRNERGKQNKPLRKSGTLPGVLYGHGVPSRALTVAQGDFLKTYRKAGESTLVDLAVDDAVPVKVIIKDVQHHPITDAITHVDFHQVTMTEKLHTEIALAFSGESTAVKELGGILVKNMDRIKVEALPGDLVPEIPVDISSLKTFDDIIHVRDLPVPNGIIVLDNADEVVALVTPPRSEAELAELEKAAVDEKAAVESVEGVKDKEKEAAAEEGTEAEAGQDAAQEPKKPESKKDE